MQGLRNLAAYQAQESERMGLELAEELGEWVKAYEQELKDRMKPKEKAKRPDAFALHIPPGKS